MGLVNLLADVVQQTFSVLYEGAFLILAGFLVAGVLHVLLDTDRIVRHLGKRSLGSATVAALLGAPIPLCSCGVLPTALSLRRKGASPEATLAFLITTPETGVDSIAMTLAFFGPVLAVVRPLAAIATGLVAAALSLRRWPPGDDAALALPVPPEAPSGHRHDAPDPGAPPVAFLGRMERLCRQAVHHAFVDLFDELGFWLALAIVLTGVLSAVLPADFFTRFLPPSFAALLVMVVLGMPLYVCASASTPLAALLVAKGASVGAALVFLLVGPATNAATIATVTRLFGRPALRIYLGSIIGVALVAGWLVDLVAPGLAASVRIGAPIAVGTFSLPKTAAALGLGWLLVESLRRTGVRAGLRELSDNTRAALAAARRVRLRAVLTSRPLQGLALLWLLSVVAGGFWRVPVGDQAIVQRLGRVAGPPRAPGLAFATPVIDRVDLVPVDAVRERAIGYRMAAQGLAREPVMEEALYVTADENVIDLHAEAQYRVADAVRYRLGVEAPADVLSAVVRARLVEAMAARSIDSVYTDDRAEVEGWLLERVRHDADQLDLGLEILAVRLLDVHAPATVHDAFRDVASAHEDRLTTIHQATEYAVGTVAVARGEAERVISEADAQAEARLATARGTTAAFAMLAAEHARSPRVTEDRLYLESAERVLPGARKIIRPAVGSTQGYDLWLRGKNETVVFPPASPSPDATPAKPGVPPPPRRVEGAP